MPDWPEKQAFSSSPDPLAALRRALSNPRLDAYRSGPDDEEADLLACYFWNVALAEALYPALHAVEVALRNALHAALSAAHGERWFDDRSVLVDPWGQQEVEKASEQLRKEGKPDDPGRIVAALDFGFWTSLLNKRYARTPRMPAGQHPLWPELLRPVFPHFPQPYGNPAAGRHALSERLNAVRQRLRNRISHHEPIWRGWLDKSTHRRVPLDIQHAQLLETIGWISPELRAAIERMDRFPDVYRRGPGPYRDLVASLV